jgi:uncharacterized peroxidase-related enzyme
MLTTPTTAFLPDPEIDAAVSAAYEEDLSSDGYVNNLTRVWCWRPDALASFQTIRADLTASSGLSPLELAILVTATTAARGDSYCTLAWGTRLARRSSEAIAESVVRGNPTGLSSREEALALWARQVVLDPNATTQADVDQLREVGFTNREIFEATVFIAYRLAFATVNDALGVVPDRELIARVPPRVREAVTFGRGNAAGD